MRLVNTTPHAIVLFTATGPLRLPAGETIARVTDDVFTTRLPNHLPVPVRDLTPGTLVCGLPAPVDGVCLIVSRAVALLRADRGDLVVPGTMRVRAQHGVIGCADLVRYHPRGEQH
ncbi:hypothetical protein ACGFIX_14370 [Nocardia salmonicida]|uniref:hypothetical protein n=1 Tax=Nocardia salmonicida TaxID=53431 RepID=UPI003714D408